MHPTRLPRTGVLDSDENRRVSGRRVSRPVLPRAGPAVSILFLREWKAFSWHSFATVRFGTQPHGKSRFVAIRANTLSFRILSMIRVRFAPSPTGYLHI